MAKKNSSSNKATSTATKYTAPVVYLPEVKTIDTLAELTDDEVKSHIDCLVSEMKSNRDTCDLYPWEVEVSYAQRELHIRSLRRRAQDAYIASGGDNFDEDEDAFPDAELDNLDFVNLARKVEAQREYAARQERRSTTVVYN